jgi:hypothetical protein
LKGTRGVQSGKIKTHGLEKGIGFFSGAFSGVHIDMEADIFRGDIQKSIVLIL